MRRELPERYQAILEAARERACTEEGRAARKASGRNYRERNTAKVKAYNEKRYRINRDVMLARIKKWQAKNADYLRKRAQKRYVENKQQYADNQRARYLAKPEAFSAARRRRRARLANAPGSHTAEDITILFNLQKGSCPVCRASLRERYHVDHVVALSRGGSDDRSNLQLLCPSCNLSKQARDPVEFMQSRGFLL